MSKDAPGVRYAEVEREAGSQTVRVVIDLDGEQQATVATGVPFFDHLLEQFAFHGNFDIGVSAEGGMRRDDHRTMEEVGVCLGQAIRQAIGEGESIDRCGTAHAPIDDTLVRVVVDVSGRSALVLGLGLRPDVVSGMSVEALESFLRAVSNHAGMTIHAHRLAGENSRHTVEAAFTAFARALQCAVHKRDRKAKGRI